VSNSFWLAGHIEKKIGMCWPEWVQLGPIWYDFWEKMGFKQSIFSKEASLNAFFNVKSNVCGQHLGAWWPACGLGDPYYVPYKASF